MVLCDPRTNVGTAPSARLIGMRCWRLRLRRPWWLSLIGCTRWLETLPASSFAAETDQLHTELEDSGARVCLPFGHSAWRSRVRGLRLRAGRA